MTRPSSFSGPVKRCKHISRCKGERVARGTSKSRIPASTVNLMALSWTQVTGPTTRTGSSAQLPPSCRKLVWQKARARSILRQRSILACSTLRIDNEHLQTHAHARTHTHSLTRLYTHQQFEAGNASRDIQLSMISGTQTHTHIHMSMLHPRVPWSMHPNICSHCIAFGRLQEQGPATLIYYDVSSSKRNIVTI